MAEGRGGGKKRVEDAAEAGGGVGGVGAAVVVTPVRRPEVPREHLGRLAGGEKSASAAVEGWRMMSRGSTREKTAEESIIIVSAVRQCSACASLNGVLVTRDDEQEEQRKRTSDSQEATAQKGTKGRGEAQSVVFPLRHLDS